MLDWFIFEWEIEGHWVGASDRTFWAIISDNQTKYFWVTLFESSCVGRTFVIFMLCLVTQLCPALWDPLDCSPPGPLSMGYFRPKYWNGLIFPTPGDRSYPEVKPCIAGRFFTCWPIKEVPGMHVKHHLNFYDRVHFHRMVILLIF